MSEFLRAALRRRHRTVGSAGGTGRALDRGLSRLRRRRRRAAARSRSRNREKHSFCGFALDARAPVAGIPRASSSRRGLRRFRAAARRRGLARVRRRTPNVNALLPEAADRPMVALLPDDAPFSAEQRAWLNGFFGGLLMQLAAQARAQVPVAPPLVVHVLHASQTGTAEGLAKKLAK